MRLSSFLAISSLFLSSVRADCSNLTAVAQPNGDLAYDHTDYTFRISPIVECVQDQVGSSQGTQNCGADLCTVSNDPDYEFRMNRTLNATVTDDLKEDIFNFIEQYLPPNDVNYVNLDESWKSKIGTVAGTCLQPEQTGWIEFEPQYRCVNVRLAECDGGGRPEGMLVRACGGMATVEHDSVIGTLIAMTSDESLGTAPAPPGSEPGENGAAQASTSAGWYLLQSLALAALVGVGATW